MLDQERMRALSRLEHGGWKTPASRRVVGRVCWLVCVGFWVLVGLFSTSPGIIVR